MSDNTQKFFMGFFFGAVAGFILLTLIYAWAFSQWQAEAIKHGAAEYNQTTGVWQWKDTPSPSPGD